MAEGLSPVDEFRILTRREGFGTLDHDQRLGATLLFMNRKSPDFAALDSPTQSQLAQRFLVRTLQPTTGERTQQLAETALPLVFGAGAGMLALPPAIATGPVIGGLAEGAAIGLGAAAGTSAAQFTRPHLVPFGPDAPLTPDLEEIITALDVGPRFKVEPRRLSEDVVALLEAFGTDTGFGFLGAFPARLVRRGREILFAQGLEEPETVKAFARMQRAGRGDLSLSPTQAQGFFTNAFTSLTENITRNAFFSSGQFARFDRRNFEFALKELDNFTARLQDMNPTALSQTLTHFFEQRRKFAAKMRSALFERFNRMVSEGRGGPGGITKVDTSQVLETLTSKQRIPAYEEVIRQAGGLDEITRRLSRLLEPEIIVGGKVMNKPAKALEANLLEAIAMSREFFDIAKSAGIRNRPVRDIANAMGALLRSRVDEALRALHPQARRAFEEANEFASATFEDLENRLVTQLMERLKNNPSTISRLILAGGGKTDDIRRIKQVLLGSPTKFAQPTGGNVWDAVQGRLARDLVEKTLKRDAQNRVIGIDAQKLVESFQEKGSEFVQSAFDGIDLKDIEDVANLIEVSSRTPSGPGGVAIRLLQAGAAGRIGTGAAQAAIGAPPPSGVLNIIIQAGGFFGLPQAIAFVYTRPKLLRATREGLAGFLTANKNFTSKGRVLPNALAKMVSSMRQVGFLYMAETDEGRQLAASALGLIGLSPAALSREIRQRIAKNEPGISQIADVLAGRILGAFVGIQTPSTAERPNFVTGLAPLSEPPRIQQLR